MGRGSSERCLKWGGGSLRDLSKNILRQGMGKGKSCSYEGGVLKVSPPLPPRKILIIHHVTLALVYVFGTVLKEK